MLRIKDGEPKECAGKYLVNKNNIGLQIIVANQNRKGKREFIYDFLKEVETYLIDLVEENK